MTFLTSALPLCVHWQTFISNELSPSTIAHKTCSPFLVYGMKSPQTLLSWPPGSSSQATTHFTKGRLPCLCCSSFLVSLLSDYSSASSVEVAGPLPKSCSQHCVSAHSTYQAWLPPLQRLQRAMIDGQCSPGHYASQRLGSLGTA